MIEVMAQTESFSEIETLTKRSKKIVFVSGNFNIVHPGHLRLLKFAADCGDFLLVGVYGKNQTKVDMPEDLRLEAVRSIGIVNHAFLLNESPDAFIKKFKPNVVVKGKEYEEKLNHEQSAVDTYGGKLLFSSGEVRFSSLDLLRKELRETNPSSVVKPLDFPQRHGFSLNDLRRTYSKFRDLRVTVIGDLIVDEYITCDPLGMSQEDPTIVVTPVQKDTFIGGAAIVAAHARGLGAQVQFFSVAGQDAPAEFARSRLQEQGVRAHILEDGSRPTTLKQRFRARGKTLLRVSHLKQHDLNHDLQAAMIDQLTLALSESNLVIFSDFNYGCLPQDVVDGVVNYCTKKNILMVADSQSSSQVGDIARFKGMGLITPTEREARLATRDFNSGLVVLAEKLRMQSRATNIILTLGSEGLLIHAGLNNATKHPTDQLPAFNTAPKDSAGAGDSLLTCASMALAVGCDIWQSSYLGSLAAACQVGRVGNIPLSPQDLDAEIEDSL